MATGKIKCVALDDEQLALDLIDTHINRHDQLELIEKFDDSVKAVGQIESLAPDVLFIDMQMPKLNGFDVIRSLKNPPLIVFTTAYNEYAAEAYEFDVFDYILKPITVSRFDKTVDKISKYFDLLQRIESSKLQDQKLIVKVDRSIVKINIGDIHYVQGLQKYVQIFTEKERFVTLMSLGKLAEELQAYGIVQCHKSFLINVNFIDKIEGRQATIGEEKIAISKSKRQNLLELFKNRL